MRDELLRYRALWAISATLLAFAGDGLQSITSAMFGSAAFGVQAGLLGSMVLGAVCIEFYARQDPPGRRKPQRKRRKPKPKITP